MNLKNLCPEEIIKISTCISLILLDKFDGLEISIIKNILCLVASNLSSYQTHQAICPKNNKIKG